MTSPFDVSEMTNPPEQAMTEDDIEKFRARFKLRSSFHPATVNGVCDLALIGHRAMQEPSEKVVQAALDEYTSTISTKYYRMAFAITVALSELRKP